ncbi:MAG: restriction endonuclease subunit S [Bacteroidetes bacterium]|nr:restriction endonuclease subunit S [Bacteroidota bacterium]
MKKGWELKRLGDICEIVNGGTPDTKVSAFWDGDNLWITPKDMGQLNSNYVDDTSRRITDEGLKNSSAKLLPVNSVILSSRAPIGHLAINSKRLSTNQGCKGLVPYKGLSSLFLYYFLKKSVGLLNSLGSGTTFKELSGSKLAEIKIPLPPLPEQHRIATLLDESFSTIAKAKENAEKNLANARELFETYLQSIFSCQGEGWEEKKLQEVCS